MSSEVLAANSPVQMTEVAVLLLFGKTPREIAEQLEIPPDRILRWQRDSTFMDIYEEVATEMQQELTQKAAEQFVLGIERLTPMAMRVLEEGMASEKVSDRLNAAGKVLALRKKPADTAAPNVISIEAQVRSRAVEQESANPASGD